LILLRDRIIDANLNRLAEGLRLLEEISRMVLNESSLTERLKTLRHDLIRGDLAFKPDASAITEFYRGCGG
jgi:thiamine-phosphate pyrophosphorylase